MNDNKYRKINLMLMIFTMVALVVSAASFSLKKEIAVATQGEPVKSIINDYNLIHNSSQEMPSSSYSVSEESYLITVYDGKIGVFLNGDTKPFLTADVEVYLLPQEDQEILRKGIRAQSITAVKGVLEDYE